GRRAHRDRLHGCRRTHRHSRARIRRVVADLHRPGIRRTPRHCVQLLVPSARDRGTSVAPLNTTPPVSNTVPLVSSVAVGSARPVFKFPVTVNVPFEGLYSSALASGTKLEPLGASPPAISTIPL